MISKYANQLSYNKQALAYKLAGKLTEVFPISTVFYINPSYLKRSDSKDLFKSFGFSCLNILAKSEVACVIPSAFPEERPFGRSFITLVIFFHIHLIGLTSLWSHENTDVIAFRQH